MAQEPLLTLGMSGNAPTSTLEGTRVESSVPSRVRATPVLTIALLVVNVVVFVLMTVAGGTSKPVVLIASGALVWPIFRLGDYGTVLTSAFIHLGIIHLLVNMTALWSMGRALEGVLGAARYALVYFTSAVTGSLLSICFIHKGASAGASGAIFGIAGAMLVVGLRHADRVPSQSMKVFGRGTIPFFVVNLVLGLSIPGINLLAHLGGALGGAACSFALAPHEDKVWARVLVIGGALAITGLAFFWHFCFLIVTGLKMHH